MNVKVTVFETPGFDSRSAWPPDNLMGFIEWFQSKLDSVPAEYKGSVIIDMETSQEYDICKVDLSIYYFRPETDEEIEARTKRERTNAETIRNRELKEYERLKAKFEGVQSQPQGGETS